MITDDGLVTIAGIVPKTKRIEVQPGDVVGFYLQSTRNTGDCIQFADDVSNSSPYDQETGWFATDSLTPNPAATCMYPVGTFGVLSSSINLAPLITVTVCKFSYH